MVFITFKSGNQTCSKLEKTWFLLVHSKKPRSSHPKVFCTKFSEFAWRTPELESLFNIVTSLRCFHVNFAKNFKNIFERLLLKIMSIQIQLNNNGNILLKEFTHIWPNNFAILFSSKRIKRENDNFSKMQLFGWACFLHQENQVFTYHAYIIDYLYIK